MVETRGDALGSNITTTWRGIECSLARCVDGDSGTQDLREGWESIRVAQLLSKLLLFLAAFI